MLCGLTIVVASVGKFGGSFVAARLTGLSWRDASALGVLMNTRGLAELIVLNIGLQLRVINPRVFAMLVVMSLVTTLATTPDPLPDQGQGGRCRAVRRRGLVDGRLRMALHKPVEISRRWLHENT